MREHSREVVRNVREMASRFLTITGLMGTLTAAATGFGFLGLDKLGERAANLRRTSAGLNTTPGRLMAARTEFSRFVDVDKWISHLRDVQLDPTKPGFAGIAALRGGKAPTRNEDTANLFADILPKFQEWAQRQQGRPGAQQAIGLMANKIFGDIDPADLSRLLRMSKGEMAEAGGRFQQQTRTDISDQTGKAFTDFITKLNEAGDTLTKTIINKFGDQKFLGALDHLVDALTGLATTIVDKLIAPGVMEKLAGYINSFADAIGSEKFQQGVVKFIDNVEAMGEKVFNAMKWLGKVVDTDEHPDALKGAAIGGGAGLLLGNPIGGAAVGGLTGYILDELSRKDNGQFIPGWGFGKDGMPKWTTDPKDQEGPPGSSLNWNDPMFKRETPHSLLHPSAYVAGGGGIGVPIVAARTLPVDIVGFGRFSAQKDKQQEQPTGPMGGLLHNATFSMPGIANDNSVLGLIRKYESGGRNVLNYRAAEDPEHFTASGYYQMIDSTWAEAKKMVGIPVGQYPHAMDAPYDEQTRAAQALLNARGLQPWETNEPLMKALRGMWLGGGADAGQASAPAPAPATSQKPDFHPVKAPHVGVTIQNETGGNVVTAHRLLAT